MFVMILMIKENLKNKFNRHRKKASDFECSHRSQVQLGNEKEKGRSNLVRFIEKGACKGSATAGH